MNDELARVVAFMEIYKKMKRKERVETKQLIFMKALLSLGDKERMAFVSAAIKKIIECDESRKKK